MKKIKKSLKKSLITLCGILGIGTLTACYGVIVNMDYQYVEGYVRFSENENDVIQGIKISIYDEDDNLITSTFTDEKGFYSLYIEEGNYKIIFEDVDEDGISYKKSEKSLETGKIKLNEIINFDVVLEKE